MSPLKTAGWTALLVPALLLGGALGSQYIGGLHPCEMCYWQRWPHEAAIAFALIGLFIRDQGTKRLFITLAALAILVSGLIGFFHAGVEYGWWEGLTQCSRMPGSDSGDFLKDIMNTPLVRCDQPQWTLGPVSLAGFNGIFSSAAAVFILKLLRARP